MTKWLFQSLLFWNYSILTLLQVPFIYAAYRFLKLFPDCFYNGVMRKSGSKWMNPNNPCEELSCKSNVVSVLRHQCYVPCQNPLPPKPGTCCPRCPGR